MKRGKTKYQGYDQHKNIFKYYQKKAYNAIKDSGVDAKYNEKDMGIS